MEFDGMPTNGSQSNMGVVSVATDSTGTSHIIYDDGNDRCQGPGGVNDFEQYSQGIGLATCNGASCSTAHVVSLDCDSEVMGVITVDNNEQPVLVFNDVGGLDPDGVHFH